MATGPQHYLMKSWDYKWASAKVGRLLERVAHELGVAVRVATA